jgi:hypothetical protein
MLKPLKTAERKLFDSNWVMRWATFASAVGETKLAFTAILQLWWVGARCENVWEARKRRGGGSGVYRAAGRRLLIEHCCRGSDTDIERKRVFNCTMHLGEHWPLRVM